jgi:hypothetical protein|tara:strand:+ start:210 stop:722 length:513 start_codon:yes stop_codon:yes gene_type:complete
MFGPVSSQRKYLLSSFFAVSIVLLFGHNSPLQAACSGEGFMGISSKNPIMSWVDLTYSPVYTSASTSGTSGCKNWDFTQYLERERRQFIKKSHQQLLVETVRGQGPHLEALSRLMECPQSSSEVFAGMLWEHRQQTVQLFETAKQTPEFMIELSKWIKADPELRNTCGMS